ncbi:MAG: 4Fe-4S binding protein [candidate division Zixibacteria bacterium]|nr:4Fe-4S binding protein [candidate division Zixibacteria bacterium]
MNEKDLALHYVCTREQAKEMVKNLTRFWISNCGCRESHGKCSRSRMDLCLSFRDDIGTSGSGKKEISLDEVNDIFKETEDKHLVTRPFRNEKNMAEAAGICFCCDDCCGYFLNPEERCDKGDFIEKTDMDLCNNCGECEQVCYFKARKMDSDELFVDRSNCYGCGLCLDICPLDCIEMVKRN